MKSVKLCLLSVLLVLLAPAGTFSSETTTDHSGHDAMKHMPAQVDTAARQETTPNQIEGVGIDEHLGDSIPLDLEFKDSTGKTVHLSDYINGEKPVIVTLGYLKCTMLCHLILRGLTQAMVKMDWTAGDEFEVVTVSIDPRETPAFAQINKQKYMELYGRPEAASGWHYLTGDNENIKPLADAIGFKYKYDEKNDMYYHTAAIFVITPDGKISRYLYGVAFEPVTLRLALLEASEGKLGSTVDRIVMYCFHYDADAGRYSPVAFNIMKVGGVFTLAFLSLLLGSMWALEKRRKKKKSKS